MPGVWADSRGELVARFAETDVKSLVAPGTVVMTLSGIQTNGDAFAGSAAVRVVNWAKPK